MKKSTARTPSPSLCIRELAAGRDWLAMYPLIRQLNPKLTRRQFLDLLPEMLAQGYRCIGAWKGGKLVGACGFWQGTRFWCGRFIDLDNVVVDVSCRNLGVGRKLVAWVEKEARRLKYDMVGLDSYASAHDAHRFYYREGYFILGYHFIKRLRTT